MTLLLFYLLTFDVSKEDTLLWDYSLTRRFAMEMVKSFGDEQREVYLVSIPQEDETAFEAMLQRHPCVVGIRRLGGEGDQQISLRTLIEGDSSDRARLPVWHMLPLSERHDMEWTLLGRQLPSNWQNPLFVGTVQECRTYAQAHSARGYSVQATPNALQGQCIVVMTTSGMWVLPLG